MVGGNHEIASVILEDIWENIPKSRKGLGVKDEFTNKVIALSHCFSDLNRFVNEICKKFGSKITQKTIESLGKNESEIMEIFRTEAQIPIVLFDIRIQERIAKWKEGNKKS